VTPNVLLKKSVWLIGILCLFVYFQGARYHADHVNLDKSRGDQRAYLNTVNDMVKTNFSYTGDRNRMPLYPYLLLPAYRSGSELKSFFERGKLLNIVYSMFLLIGLFFVFRKRLKTMGAINLLLVTGFTVFIFRSGYVQCEVLFYTLTFLVFYGMTRMFYEPTWKKAVLTGVLLGLAQMTKASVLPSLVLFCLFFSLNIFRGFSPKKTFLHVTLFVLSFFIVVFPYINESKEKFGSYFYNVNSTFYMWTDSWSEAKSLTRAHGDRLGWPDMPEEQIPSPSKYFREHTLKDVGLRVFNGIKRLKGEVAISYGYQYFMLLYAIWFVVACIRSFDKVSSWLKANLVLSGFVLSYLMSYFILYAWYVPINGGPRQLLMLFLPFMFGMLLGIESFLTGRINLSKLSVPVKTVFHTSVLAAFVFLGNGIMQSLFTRYAGN
jgi:hypothetical protein